jgi:hypothetical protein
VTDKAGWDEVRELIEEKTGPVSNFRQVSEGRNSEVSVIVASGGEITFVKGRRADHPWAWTQKREREINPAVAHISAPVKWSVITGTWDLNGFAYLAGRHADYAPGSADLPKVAATMRQLQEIPCPDIEVKHAEHRWRHYTQTPELLAGPALLHTEWTPANVLVNHGAYIVDWAWPTRGAAWIDPAAWAVWLIAAGHAPESAERWASEIPSWHHAPPGAVNEFARIQASMWSGIWHDSGQPWAETVTKAAMQWCDHRGIAPGNPQ